MIPTPNPLPRWHQLYIEDLERFPVLLAALNEDDPIGAVARGAKLSALETYVLRSWAAGDSVRSTAAATGRHRAVIEDLTLRAKYKILLWLVRARGCLQTDSLLVEGPMNAESPPGPMDLADDPA